MNSQELAICTGAQIDRATAFLPFIEAAMCAFDINTPARQAAFLAQVGHESGGLKWLTELWGPTPAQTRYEGRKDLGNTQIGDGYKYRGRGLIQTTGRSNYRAAGIALTLDFEANPGLLSQPANAAMSAAYFWHSNGLNDLADVGRFDSITRRINGGTNGAAERQALYEVALPLLA